MIQLTALDIIILSLIAIHFGTPLAYYYYAIKKWLPLPWNIKRDPNYQPRISIIVPTYNEEKLITKKLDDLEKQDYPREKLEIIMIDSASTDKTVQLAQQWKQKHQDTNLKIIIEEKREGKGKALNKALKHTTGEVIIITDADAWWPQKNTLKKVTEWLADPTVGAVSCIKIPQQQGPAKIETGYRNYYNTLRIAESKKWSTPIFHGELAAFRKKFLEELGGFPSDLGADDSHVATLITLRGHRAIIPQNVLCLELMPSVSYLRWRVRRGQHLIQHFMKILKIKPKIPRQVKIILLIEIYLHFANPWILLILTSFLATSIIMGSILAVSFLAMGTMLLAYKPYRTWVATQLYLIIASLRNLWKKEIIWEKQAK